MMAFGTVKRLYMTSSKLKSTYSFSMIYNNSTGVMENIRSEKGIKVESIDITETPELAYYKNGKPNNV